MTGNKNKQWSNLQKYNKVNNKNKYIYGFTCEIKIKRVPVCILIFLLDDDEVVDDDDDDTNADQGIQHANNPLFLLSS